MGLPKVKMPGISPGFVPGIPGIPSTPLGPSIPKLPNIPVGPLKNTPFDPNKLGQFVNGKSPLGNTPLDGDTWAQSFKDILAGAGAGKEKTKATYGSELATPELSQYEGIGTLGDKGILQASNVSGNDISRQMEESPWYRMALQKQGAEQALNLNQAGQQNAAAAAQAQSALAMRGGLRSGAAERLAGLAGENTAMMRQNIMGQGAVERGNLGMQAANLSSNLAQYNAGNQQQAQFGNVQNQIANLGNVNDQSRFKYGEQMKLKGAGMSAQAIENAGKK